MAWVTSPILNISAQLSETTGKKRNEIREIISQAGSDPTPLFFWKLSRMIRLSQPEEVKPNLDQLFKLVYPFREQYLSATFSFANILRQASIVGQNDSYKWARSFVIPQDPYLAIKLFSLVASPMYSIPFDPNFDILRINDYSLQDSIADILVASHKKPANFLHRILFTISEKEPNPLLDPTLKTVLIPKSELSPALLRGFIALARRLLFNPIPTSEYYISLFPFISNPKIQNEYLPVAEEVQLLFSSLLNAFPYAFHGKYSLLPAALAQFKCRNLCPEFLKAILHAYGLSAIKFAEDIISEIIPGLLKEAGKTIDYVEAILPYASFLTIETQLQAHEALISLCTRFPFNTRYLTISGYFISNSSPTQSPFMGQFLEIAARSSFDISLFKSEVEPKAMPLLNSKRELMKISEREKRDAQTQIQPTLKSMIVQCSLDMQPKKIDVKKQYEPKKETFQKPLMKLEPPVKRPNLGKLSVIPDDMEADIDLDF